MVDIPFPRDVNLLHLQSDVDSKFTAQHHTLGSRRNQATPGDHNHDGTTSRLLEEYVAKARNIRVGLASVSFSNMNSWVQAVAFGGEDFTSAPMVFTNIHSSDGQTGRWTSRGYGITTSGFNLWVAGPDTSLKTWSNVGVQWLAVLL